MTTSATDLSCPLPLTETARVLLGHGSGGRMSADLIRRMFLPRFGNPYLDRLDDQAVVDLGGQRLAFTTDSFVVKPLFFPGGDIGTLKVVDKGSGDQCFINTAGIGVVEHPWILSADRARPGDRVIVSGTIGDHGMAVMSRRE